MFKEDENLNGDQYDGLSEKIDIKVSIASPNNVGSKVDLETVGGKSTIALELRLDFLSKEEQTDDVKAEIEIIKNALADRQIKEDEEGMDR
ncbi:MAG: hypothetical protein UT13_C0001G0851 [Candidatus Pacebacteria bacterium GW2011_GWF2_38_9]|nr:MAG: hypothetical protein US01_C0001G0890 [candidate division TM6 bacterium GW2011_GWF2_28_16]KKQ09458.1 MAG: hypothetical protein US20_C0007G0013 [Candidatus Pacebacteria bacterium GW2011_GWF1_36_5]KKQ89203.1 MAG: hypothetical protein UT13_C0001G0851 [Candidatus Pacebacteria bacterium GW2011_GWF2_38_9]HAZ73774.1 hypothetical protein [Candidatus Paceibacterota bacterium]